MNTEEIFLSNNRSTLKKKKRENSWNELLKIRSAFGMPLKISFTHLVVTIRQQRWPELDVSLLPNNVYNSLFADHVYV